VVPFDVVAGGDCVIGGGGGVTHLRGGFEVLDLSVMQSSLCFADVEGRHSPSGWLCIRL